MSCVWRQSDIGLLVPPRTLRNLCVTTSGTNVAHEAADEMLHRRLSRDREENCNQAYHQVKEF